MKIHEIRTLAIEHADEQQLRSNRIYDWSSSYEGFMEGLKVKLNLPVVGVPFKDKNTPTFEEWYDDIYTQMYLNESAFKKYFEMSEEELLLRYKKKFKVKP